MISPPKPGSYPKYFQPYISMVDEKEGLIESLSSSLNFVNETLALVSEDKEEYRYEKDKWTIKELVVHIIDAERIFNSRALRFARMDDTVLPGFNEKEYAQNSYANNRSLQDIQEEFNAVRQSTICLFKSIPDEILDTKGSANGLLITPRALGFINAGHSIHHMNIIKERYLN